jgi:hypothetical protein
MSVRWSVSWWFIELRDKAKQRAQRMQSIGEAGGGLGATSSQNVLHNRFRARIIAPQTCIR